jgi:hypothetical protein
VCPAAPDDQVVVNAHAEWLCSLYDVLGDRDVRLGRGRVVQGMGVYRTSSEGTDPKIIWPGLSRVLDVERLVEGTMLMGKGRR